MAKQWHLVSIVVYIYITKKTKNKSKPKSNQVNQRPWLLIARSGGRELSQKRSDIRMPRVSRQFFQSAQNLFTRHLNRFAESLNPLISRMNAPIPTFGRELARNICFTACRINQSSLAAKIRKNNWTICGGKYTAYGFRQGATTNLRIPVVP